MVGRLPGSQDELIGDLKDLKKKKKIVSKI